MQAHPAAQDQAHLAARSELLRREKELNKLRDELSEQRRNLPKLKVSKDYSFHTKDGRRSLDELFGSHRQLLIYHFMFPNEWEQGCKSCSLCMDGIDGALPHLAARNTALVAVARGSFEKIDAFRHRMGWSVPFASSGDSEFNDDFGVTLSEERREAGTAVYNYRECRFPVSEVPGLSSFSKGDDGAVYYHYSTYARGLDPMMPVYQLLDLTSIGRDESNGIMNWVRLHDEY